MKSLLIALMVLLPAAAKGASPEEGYLASRDRYIAKFKQSAGQADDRVRKAEERALGDLEKQLRRIIGSLSIEGFSPQGKINLDTLTPGEIDFGRLDGLVYSSADDKTRVLVTTDALLDRWLRAHRNWWPGLANVPQAVGDALKSEAFYTQALATDAAIGRYAELPVAKPAKAGFAFAMLAARSQDIGPRTPEEVIVSVVQAGRVFVVSAPANAKVDPIPACEEVWREYQGKADSIFSAYTASDPKDDKLLAEHTQLQEEGDAAFRRCFAERARNEGFFAKLVEQAQALVDRLPLR